MQSKGANRCQLTTSAACDLNKKEGIPMARSMWLSRAVIIENIDDRVDDSNLVDAVSGQKAVKAFAAEITALRKTLLSMNKEKIEELLGKPGPKPAKDYAIPVPQPRAFAMSGKRYADEKLNKDHTAFYPVGDFAGIEVWYGIDGRSPQFAALYFKVDDAFPRLKVVEEKAADKPAKPAKAPAVVRKHTIDVDHWNRMKAGMTREQLVALFSAPAGDHAPGTDYLTRAWGWRRGSDGKVQETLEWRSEKGRIVVEFDEKGNFVTSEFFYPGRDPVTNIAERLRWDREKFDKLKKYIEERQAAK
jgi:hypothetical protein